MRKQIDNLTRDAMAALACGMSYGKYMAMYHNGPAKQKAKEEPKERETFYYDPTVTIAICSGCGKQFVQVRKGHIYCSERCGARVRAKKRYYMEKEAKDGND